MVRKAEPIEVGQLLRRPRRRIAAARRKQPVHIVEKVALDQPGVAERALVLWQRDGPCKLGIWIKPPSLPVDEGQICQPRRIERTQRQAHAADIVQRPMMRTRDAAGSRLGDRCAIAAALGVDPPANAIARFDDGDVVADMLQFERRGQAAHSGACDQDLLSLSGLSKSRWSCRHRSTRNARAVPQGWLVQACSVLTDKLPTRVLKAVVNCATIGTIDIFLGPTWLVLPISRWMQST